MICLVAMTILNAPFMPTMIRPLSRPLVRLSRGFLRARFRMFGRQISFFVLVMITSAVTLFSSVRTWQAKVDAYGAMKSNGVDTTRILMSKWRAERNFWICLFGCTLYWCLYSYSESTAKCERLEKECAQLRAKVGVAKKKN